MNTEQLTYPMMLDFECGKDIFDPQESNMISQWGRILKESEHRLIKEMEKFTYGRTEKKERWTV